MLSHLRAKYIWFHATFHDSEVILWARVQYLFGLIYAGMQVMDMSLFISDKKLLQLYFFANAMVTEGLRRRNAEWNKDDQ